MIVMARIDNRLIHGQVVEAWLPHLKADRVVVADDQAAESPLVRSAMDLAVHGLAEVEIERSDAVDFQKLSQDKSRALLVLRSITAALDACRRGLRLKSLNLGNVHFEEGRRQVTPSVFLSDDELEQLRTLSSEGVEIEAQAVPSDKAVDFEQMLASFKANAKVKQ